MKRIRTLLVGLTALSWALSMVPGHVSAQDAPRHDVYVATARCFDVPEGRISGIPISAIMRDDEDAIDAVLQRFDDLGMVCLGDVQVAVVYLS